MESTDFLRRSRQWRIGVPERELLYNIIILYDTSGLRRDFIWNLTVILGRLGPAQIGTTKTLG
ncbi:uncharacterized protein G2W53_044034 [Senna tora]|uniref:Uncharacterized protein n=1 Tax=Senna tora TaxID=362788 RepID=A0A834SIR3_9FABA|nr:uncharacterized protein G2W53_044034 [Senna tora]